MAAEKIYTMDECSALLKIKKRTLYELTRLRKISHFKIGKENHFTQADIDEYIKANHIPSDRDIKRTAVAYCAAKPLLI